jgi:uncharacterized protein
MTPEFLALLIAGAAAGGFINGLAGFGTAMFSLGIWLQIMPPLQAVSIVVIMSVVSGLQGVWVVRHSLRDHPRRLVRFLVPGLVGIPLGVAALSVIDPKTLKIAVAAIMVLYGGFFILRRTLPQFERPTPVRDGVVGFLGGILGGAASLSGALPTMWCSLRPWSKSQTRAVLQPYNIVILGLTASALAVKGAYNWEAIKLLGIALPVALIFAQLGLALFKRLSDDQFRRLLIVLMFVGGVALMLKELAG